MYRIRADSRLRSTRVRWILCPFRRTFTTGVILKFVRESLELYAIGEANQQVTHVFVSEDTGGSKCMWKTSAALETLERALSYSKFVVEGIVELVASKHGELLFNILFRLKVSAEGAWTP